MASISWVADSPLWRMFSRFVFALVGPESSSSNTVWLVLRTIAHDSRVALPGSGSRAYLMAALTRSGRVGRVRSAREESLEILRRGWELNPGHGEDRLITDHYHQPAHMCLFMK